jgi:hypothetical protein
MQARSRNRVVGIVTRLLAGRPGFRIPVGVRDFSLLQDVQTSSGAGLLKGRNATGM